MATLQELQECFPKNHEKFLKQLFLNCPKEVIHSICVTHYKKDYNLISTYRESRFVYILLQGKLQAIEERVVDIPYSFTQILPVDIVGDYELFTEIEGHYVTLNTVEPTVCLELPSAMYLYWMKHDANAMFLRTQMLMKVLSIQTQQQRQYLAMDNKTRLISYITNICEQQKDNKTFHILVTREKIAAQIGCSIRTLNRILLSLSKEKLISVTHGKIQLSTHQLQCLHQFLENKY
ncbi:MAG: Crp/Fnr family transcriptional regulator [Longicatena sp.]